MTAGRLLALDDIVLAAVAACWVAAAIATVTATRSGSPRTASAVASVTPSWSSSSRGTGVASVTPSRSGSSRETGAVASVRPSRDIPSRAATVAAGLIGLALLVTGLRVVLVVALAQAGWWFAADRVLVALPMVAGPGLVAAIVTLPRLLRLAASPHRAAEGHAVGPVLVAGYGGLGGVLVAMTVSYPVSAVAAGGIAALVAGASAATLRLHASMQASAGREQVSARGGRVSAVCGVVVLCFALVWGGLSVWSSRLPGHLHLGAPGTAQAAGVAVTDLRESGRPDRTFTLTARPATITLASGRKVEAWTFDGRVPGPTLRVRQGDLVEVRLRNRMPGLAVTLHWHGYHVPAGDDGVAGVTQDAVRPGGEFVYRFRARQHGSYWYHSHDTSDPAVRMGLFGMFVVDPPTSPASPADQNAADMADHTAAVHTQSGVPTVADHTVAVHSLDGVPTVAVDDRPPADGLARLPAAPGTPVRLRVAATDNTPVTLALTGTPYRLAAVDGHDLDRPDTLRGRRLRLAAGGRYDLTFTMPAGPVLLTVNDRPGLGLLLGDGPPPAPERGPLLDVTAYGAARPLPRAFDQRLTWVLDRRLALLDGAPAMAHTVNGQVWPHIETPVVRRGDLIKITVVNRGKETHPMHPHGHHVLVLSRNGRPAAGSLWMDSFDVAPGEVWEVALRADNPGIWMAHCHDLGHAALGMTFHLAYEGVTTPFDAGADSGNHPE
ncbi:multicopper oxidase family protein [Nonomuraea rubra]